MKTTYRFQGRHGYSTDPDTGHLSMRQWVYSSGLGRLLSSPRFRVGGYLAYSFNDAGLVSLFRHLVAGLLQAKRITVFPTAQPVCNGSQDVGNVMGLAETTSFFPGHETPGSLDTALNLAAIVALLNDLAIPYAERVLQELFDKILNRGPAGADVAAQLIKLKELRRLLRLKAGLASVWTRIQCYECGCLSWPWQRKVFGWNATEVMWHRCNLDKTRWGKRSRNSTAYVDDVVLFFLLLPVSHATKILKDCEDQARNEATKLCQGV